MKKLFIAFLSILLVTCTYAQNLSHVKFTGGTTFSSFSFVTDQGIIIRISDNGKLLEWGVEADNRRYNYYPGMLDPYIGRVDYYGQEYDSIMRGKVKSIGTCLFTYYSATETNEKAGKIKMVGRTLLDYYDNYENPAFKGKLKFAGSQLLSYYSSYENEAFRGKLKAIASTSLTYYSTFDDKMIKGKIKSIGTSNYAWYTSNSSTGYGGGLKSGSVAQIINGITYIIM
jgi:hypothetical protein